MLGVLCDDTRLMARFRLHGRRSIRSFGVLVAAGFLTLTSAASSSASPIWPAYGHARVVGVVRRSGPRVALTFDDCENATAWRSILSTLHHADVRAAFFCFGTSVEGHVKLARRVLGYGSMLCNHTWSHRDLTTLSDEAIKQQLLSTRRAIRHISGSTCRYMRPPYGSYDRRVLEIAVGSATTAPRSGRSTRATGSSPAPRDHLARPVGDASGINRLDARVARDRRSVACHPEGAAQHKLQPVTLATLVRIGVPTNGGWPSYRDLPR